MCFPPFGRADNRKSCNLNGERLSYPGVTFARHVNVSRMVLRDMRFTWLNFFVFCLKKNDDLFYENTNCGFEYVLNRL